MDYQKIIDKYYPSENELRRILLIHSRQVANRCLKIAKAHPELRLDVEFLEESAMLHDIGIFRCDAPSIQCFGMEPYIRHGFIGGQILREEGWVRHALVCERHTGTRLSREQIERQHLPLPLDVRFEPEALEEHIQSVSVRWWRPLKAWRSLEKKVSAASSDGQKCLNNVKISANQRIFVFFGVPLHP